MQLVPLHAPARCVPTRFGGLLCRMDLRELRNVAAPAEFPMPEIVELLDRLRLHHPAEARVVDLKVFSGMTFDEVSGALHCSPRKVRRLWASAKSTLRAGLSTGAPTETPSRTTRSL